MVCTVDIRQPCLLLYPLDEWGKIEQNYFHSPTLTQINAVLQRVMLRLCHRM